MLNEIDPAKIDENTKWETIKELLKNDKRYRAVSSKSEREKLFLDFMAEKMAARQQSESSLLPAMAGKRLAPEDEKGGEPVKPQPRDRKEDEKILMEILKEHVKQTNLSWFDAEKLIEKDKRYPELELSSENKTYVYKSFIKWLKSVLIFCFAGNTKKPGKKHMQNRRERREQYKQLLKEMKEITYKSKFEECKKLLESDERYLQLPRHERQNLFNDYIRELEDNIKSQFKQMMKESAYITKDSQTEGQAFEDLVKVLRSADVRFRRMDAWPDARDYMLKEYIMKLKGKKK